ncbi:hypothetical protein Aduo_019962 [Ancylostoma duodenale]
MADSSVQQLQAAALLHGGGGGLLAAPAQLAQAAAAGVALAAAPSAAALQLPLAVSAATAASRKRPLDEESLAADQQQAHFLNLAAAVSAAAGVPCKRPAVDKNGAVVYSANPQPAQQFSPYVLPGLQGYVPAVSSDCISNRTGMADAATQPYPLKNAHVKATKASVDQTEYFE